MKSTQFPDGTRVRLKEFKNPVYGIVRHSETDDKICVVYSMVEQYGKSNAKHQGGADNSMAYVKASAIEVA